MQMTRFEKHGSRSGAHGGRLAVLLLLLPGCALVHHPSARTLREFTRPDGREVTCYEPPADVVPAQTLAEIDGKIPQLLDVLRLRVDVGQRVELLRAEVKNLQAIEVLEFRVCAAWAQGAVGEVEYVEFLRAVLPLLREACRGEAEGAAVE